MKKLPQIIMLFLFVAVIFAVPIIAKTEKKSNFLYYENRNVNYIDAFTVDGFLDGSFFQSVEDYFTDIFPYREDILAFHTYLDRSILKKPRVNDVVFVNKDNKADNILLAGMDYADCNEEDIKNNSRKMSDKLDSFNKFVEAEGGKFYYVALNEQYSYFKDKYPENIFNNQEKLEKTNEIFLRDLKGKNVPYINMAEVFEKAGKKDSFYSKIDHHYSYEGAFVTYKAIIDRINQDTELNIPKLEEEDFIFEEIPNNYIGSRNRKLMGVYNFEERLEIGYPKKAIPFERWDNGAKSENKLFFYPQDKGLDVTYLAYMGGDMAETVLKTNRGDLKKLLIIGDSFTNPLETIIYTSFDEMRSIDLRKYNKMDMREYIKEYKPDVVLMVRDDTSYFTFEGNGQVE